MTDRRETHVKVYNAADAPRGGLAGQVVAVLGYGNLGRTAALNLRDSGLKVRIGNREDEYAARARAEGFEVVPLSVAATDDIIYVLLPDEVIPGVFAGEIAPWLRPGSAVAFGSGYSLAFGLIHPPPMPSTCCWWRPAWRGTQRGAGTFKATGSGPASGWRPTRAAAGSSACWGWPKASGCCAPAPSR